MLFPARSHGPHGPQNPVQDGVGGLGVQRKGLRGQIRWEAPPLGHVWERVLFVLKVTRGDSQRAQTLTGQAVSGGGWCPAGQAFSLKHNLIQVQPN